jgi:DNA mismatch repair ATPase MutS
MSITLGVNSMDKKDIKSGDIIRALKGHMENNKLIEERLSVLEETKKMPDAEDLQMILDQQWDIARIVSELVYGLEDEYAKGKSG